ncbi:MAG: EAL domain-containing protein, partial [Eggerthellaceae bacterium]|nr:EAL domain-containing protein [Eggerthellaceae bacterium]
DALKLDMQFIRSAFAEGGDTKMIEIIIDIADYLSVPVIAEGVETEEQLNALRDMGCDRVQGYYFSPPVPAGEFEKFVAERNEIDVAVPEKLTPSREIVPHHRSGAFGEVTHAFAAGFDAIFYVDIESDHYVEFTSQGKPENLQIENSGSNFFEDARGLLFEAIYPDDEMRVGLNTQKNTLLLQLAGHDPFYMTYRIVENGRPVYHAMKAIKARANDDHHIVVGISNIDVRIQQALTDMNIRTKRTSSDIY